MRSLICVGKCKVWELTFGAMLLAGEKIGIVEIVEIVEIEEIEEEVDGTSRP